MRIAFVADGYQPVASGVYIAIKTLARELRALGHFVYIFAPDSGGKVEDPKWVVPLPAHGIYIARPFRAVNPITAWRTFTKLFRKLKIELVHLHFPSLTELAAWRAARAEKLPYVITYHSHIERNIPHYFPAPLDRAAPVMASVYSRISCNHADLVIAPTRGIARLLKRYRVTSPIEIVPNPVDLNAFVNADGARVRRPLKLAQKPALVHVGRLATEKNIGFIFKSLKRLILRFPDIALIMVGTGKDEKSIKELAHEMDIANRLIFTGHIEDRKKLADFYSAGDVFVFASLTETQGLVITEAQACGTPVVAVAAPGVRDVLTHGQGGFLTRHNLAAFTDQITALLENTALRRAQSLAALRSARHFAPRPIAKQLIAHYENLFDRL